jgi:hypothetical protein
MPDGTARVLVIAFGRSHEYSVDEEGIRTKVADGRRTRRGKLDLVLVIVAIAIGLVSLPFLDRAIGRAGFASTFVVLLIAGGISDRELRSAAPPSGLDAAGHWHEVSVPPND